MDCEGKKRALHIQDRVDLQASSAIGVKWLVLLPAQKFATSFWYY